MLLDNQMNERNRVEQLEIVMILAERICIMAQSVKNICVTCEFLFKAHYARGDFNYQLDMFT